jgi:hypothetical protein
LQVIRLSVKVRVAWASVKVIGPGAQTERRGNAGPVRGLPGGKTSPAVLFLLSLT